jgi:hypothetical protein
LAVGSNASASGVALGEGCCAVYLCVRCWADI